jgi:pimeloyl-ACP methyl ester carboxylesterase
MAPADLTTRWHTVEIEGVRQAYEVAGSGPICVVHSGGPGINAGYLRMPSLERHLTMIYLDPIGTGRSGFLPGGRYDVPEYARRAAALLELRSPTIRRGSRSDGTPATGSGRSTCRPW